MTQTCACDMSKSPTQAIIHSKEQPRNNNGKLDTTKKDF